MKPVVVSLKELLTIPDTVPSNHGVAMASAAPMDLHTKVLVFNFDDLNDEQDMPDQARESGYAIVLTKPEIEDIVLNCKLQRNGASPEELVKSLEFYLKNDAFIVFDL